MRKTGCTAVTFNYAVGRRLRPLVAQQYRELCFGGSSTPWSSRFKPNRWVSGYEVNAGSFIATQPGAGFFYLYAPFSGAIPFNAYPLSLDYSDVGLRTPRALERRPTWLLMS